MVVFSCDACGDSLRKKDVQKHYQFKCRTCESLTCVDCKKQFWGDDYANHTQCITDEEFKYGLVSQHKDDKGQVKQNQWRSNIDIFLSDRSTDKRWTPILLEMQKYENVPRKKKPFMNWCKCTMKRFPLKVVEEIFDKLLEMNTKAQQTQEQQTARSKNGQRENNMDTEGGDNYEEGDAEENGSMDVDSSDAKKGSKKDKKKNKHLNGNAENSNDSNTKDKNQSKKKRKKSDDSDDEGEMEHDGDNKKKKRKNAASGDDIPEEEEDPNREIRAEKFRLKKCVVQILAAKDEPVKVKRILKKVLAAYNGFIEAREASGGKGKTWSEHEVSAKLEKLIATNKAFKNCNGVVQLSATGKAKYISENGAVVESD